MCAHFLNAFLAVAFHSGTDKAHTHFICLYRICQRLTRLIVAAHYHNKHTHTHPEAHTETRTTNVIVTGCCPTPSSSLHTCIIKRGSHPERKAEQATQVDLVISLTRMPHKFVVMCQKKCTKTKCVSRWGRYARLADTLEGNSEGSLQKSSSILCPQFTDTFLLLQQSNLP